NLWGANGNFNTPPVPGWSATDMSPQPPHPSQPAIGVNPSEVAGANTTFGVSVKYSPGSTGPQVCVPGGAQTAHPGGIHVCLGDASCRAIAQSASTTLLPPTDAFKRSANQTIFNALLTPA